MSNIWNRDALIFELNINKYSVDTYQKLLCEAASCGIDRAVYCVTKELLGSLNQNRQIDMITKLKKTCDILEMKFFKAPAIILPEAFEIPKVGKVNEFGEIVSALIGLPSLVDYQKQRSKEIEFIKKRER